MYEAKVRGLESQTRAMQQIHIKKHGYITMRTRTTLAHQVALNGASFTKAYALVHSVFTNMLPDHELVGHIQGADAQLQAAISSVAMTGRMVQFVRAWEMARVVSGDGGEMRGDGLEWQRDARPAHDPCWYAARWAGASGFDSDNRAIFERTQKIAVHQWLFELESQPEADQGGAEDGGRVSEASVRASIEALSSVEAARQGSFLALAFDGTSTWWGNGYVALAIAFRLGGLSLSKMAALLEKIETTAVGAKKYVEVIMGWIDDVRALQRRLGEKEADLLSIYDFGVFMVDNCPENIGLTGGVCALLEAERDKAYREMAASGVRGRGLGKYVGSTVANCGLHVVNTFSSNYNNTWKRVDAILVARHADQQQQIQASLSQPESAQLGQASQGTLGSEGSVEQCVGADGGDGEERVAGAAVAAAGTAHDAKHGIWSRVNSAKSAKESKAMTYARWTFTSLSTATIFREFLAAEGVTQEWKRTLTSRCVHAAVPTPRRRHAARVRHVPCVKTLTC